LFIHPQPFPNPEVAEAELSQVDNISSSSLPPLPTSSLPPLPTSLLVLDSVEFHKTEAVKTKAKELNTILSFVPPGLTHKLQPLDVSFNKPFKQRVQELQDSMSIAERPDRDLHEWTTSERRIFMTKVVATAYNLLHEEKSEMVRKSFICTGINLHPNGEDNAAISIKGLDSSDIDLSDWRTIPTPGMDGLEVVQQVIQVTSLPL